jgi:hypothetical protein
MLPRSFILVLTVALLAGCDQARSLDRALPGSRLEERDLALELCDKRIQGVKARPKLPGAPAYDARRAEFLGRAYGEPTLFVAEPQPAGDDEIDEELARWRRSLTTSSPAGRLSQMQRWYKQRPQALRQLVLRSGYVYSDDPVEAFHMVKSLTLTDLFDEPTIHLERGDTVHRLERQRSRYERGFEYRHADGPEKGRVAKLLFADRVAVERDALGEPLHRDLRSLRDRVGFDRMRAIHATEEGIAVELRFGERWAPALLSEKGAHLELECLALGRAERAAIDAHVAADAPRRRAVAALQRAVGELVADRLPFDRPYDAEDHLDDGQLRPGWESAYRRGQEYFHLDGNGYPVFDADGRPHPPEMCVEMILDAFERGAGTWYRPKGEPPGRIVGRLDFNAYGIKNRSGVLAFEKFVTAKPELFTVTRFEERIPFAQRERFFAYLLKEADRLMPGDVVAIQGPKPDGYVHQHAILIEDVDPVSGFPYGLADQMKFPRRRSFEAIMAEAPRRALLFHVRPKPVVLMTLDAEGGDGSGKLARSEGSGAGG